MPTLVGKRDLRGESLKEESRKRKVLLRCEMGLWFWGVTPINSNIRTEFNGPNQIVPDAASVTRFGDF